MYWLGTVWPGKFLDFEVNTRQHVGLHPFVMRGRGEAKNVDYLLIAKSVVQLNHLGIHHSCAPTLLGGGRFVRVLIEGRALRPPDEESSARNL